MKEIKRKHIVPIFVFMFLFVLAGTTWSAISLPTAILGGSVQTTASLLLFDNVYMSRVNYADGVSFADANGPDESIIYAEVVISGATRTGPLTFTDASLEIRDPSDSFQYLTATLNNITFLEIAPNIYYLNLALDADNPATLNLSNVVLNTDGSHPSRFIDELAIELGTNNIAGLKLGIYVIGDITGAGTGYIFDGLIDGVPNPTNSPPTAEAGVTFVQEQCLATECEVTLDGSESTDPDSTPTYNDIVSYEWYEDSVLIATGEVTTVLLPLGFHDIKLVITDSKGATDEDTITVVIDAAELSFIEIKKAVVKWNDDEIKIKGKLALPAGVSHLNVNSVGQATISLSTLGPVVNESVVFEVKGNNKKWKYDAHPALGIHKFKIDWHGAKFKYQKDFLEIESHHFGFDTTTLEIEFHKQSAGPATIIIGGVTISIDGNDVVTVTPNTIEVDVDYGSDKTEIEVVLPFALTTDMVIDISGTINDSVLVGDYYKAAVGKFKLKAKFDSTGIDPSLLEPSLTLDVGLGAQGFNGTLLIGPYDWTKVTTNKWKYKKKD